MDEPSAPWLVGPIEAAQRDRGPVFVISGLVAMTPWVGRSEPASQQGGDAPRRQRWRVPRFPRCLPMGPQGHHSGDMTVGRACRSHKHGWRWSIRTQRKEMSVLGVDEPSEEMQSSIVTVTGDPSPPSTPSKANWTPGVDHHASDSWGS
jgi:hypothetical protein